MEGHPLDIPVRPHPLRWIVGLMTIVLVGCSSAPYPAPAGGAPTGANIITAEDIAAFPSTLSVEEIIQQFAPGIYLRRRNEPGGEMAMDVRAMGVPLFVIDGVPSDQRGGNLGLNPRDIESIEILKHGGSLAMYGLRGANGVVIIRTKGSATDPLQ